MRRESRRKENMKKGIIIGGVCAIIIAVAIIIYLTFLTYSISNEIKMDEFSKDNLNATSENEKSENLDSESASTDIGKTVNEAENELNEDTPSSSVSTVTSHVFENEEEQQVTTENTKKVSNKETKKEVKEETKSKQEKKEEKTEEKEPKFTAPVKGEIIREFATDSLVYSNTLDEWVTHNGVDIKADKTCVVSAAANGTVYAIKNDPRYGLTVIINHDAGYQTVYSNLLTAEFVVEGEKVEAGQTIGTVGNSASFEISDDYHLHFEILKNNKYIDPTTCIN